MHTKEQTTELLRQAFCTEGSLTYKTVFKYGIYQHDIKKFFGTLDNVCKELGLLNIRKKTKDVQCAKCSKVLTISKHSLDDFDRYCDDCKIILHNAKFDGLQKDIDYLECPACGFKNKSLEGHFRKNAKTWRRCKFTKEEVKAKFGKLKMFASDVDKRAKNARRKNGWFKDKEATLERMSASGGKHCLGKTKENCEYVRKISEIRKQGCASGKYDFRKYKISKEDLEKTAIEDGINLRISANKLNATIVVINYLCKKYNLLISRKWKLQTFILKMISKILETNHIEEFQFKKTRFRFDGLFEKYKLLVEVNGYQHYVYPNHFHRTRRQFEKNQERDILKQQLAVEKGYKLLTIGYKDDLSEQGIRTKLVEQGILFKLLCSNY
jgi:hypothetical protein